MSRLRQPRAFSSRYAVTVVVVVLAIALGSGVTAAWMAAKPQSLAAAKTLDRAPVTKHDFDDARAVQVTVSRGIALPVVSNTDGHVTAYTCAAGQPIVSGTSFVSVNGTPLLALSTTVPLWRSMARDDKGPDVRALQVELQRLGYGLSADGTYGSNTAKAVERLLTTIDGTGSGIHESADAGLPLSRVLWIPANSVTPARCDSQLGARVVNGDKLLTTASTDTTAHIVNMPDDLIAGARIFTAGGLEVPVNADGTITDPASVTALSVAAEATINESPSGDTASNPTGDSAPSARKVSGQIALATPRATNSVPPSAIVGVDGAQGCVVGDGRTVAVTIIGSQLGQTFVEFAPTTSQPRTVDVSPSESTSCG